MPLGILGPLRKMLTSQCYRESPPLVYLYSCYILSIFIFAKPNHIWTLSQKFCQRHISALQVSYINMYVYINMYFCTNARVVYKHVCKHVHINMYICTCLRRSTAYAPPPRPHQIAQLHGRAEAAWPSRQESSSPPPDNPELDPPGKYMYVCVYVCMYVCMYVCIYIYYKHTCTYIYPKP